MQPDPYHVISWGLPLIILVIAELRRARVEQLLAGGGVVLAVGLGAQKL